MDDFREVDLETISLRSLRNLPAMESGMFEAFRASDFPESCPKERDFNLLEVLRKTGSRKGPKRTHPMSSEVSLVHLLLRS